MTTSKPSTRFAHRTLTTTAGVALLLSAARTPAMAGNLCISMGNSGGQVAGIQADLKWDGACMDADKGSGTSGRCTADPSTGKDIRTTIKPGPTMKAIFFSMADTSPIPDGDLFCCSFTPASRSGNACCGLSMGNVLGSDSVGKAIPASGFSLVATMDGQPCAASDGGSGSGQQRAPVRSGLQGGGGVAPPVVAVPGGAPAAPPAPGAAPVAPAGRGAAPEAPAGMDQVQRALEQLAPRQAPTAPAEATAGAAANTPRPAAGTPTAKVHATEAHGTPTAAAKKTPSPAATQGTKTPGSTPEPTPKAPAKSDGF